MPTLELININKIYASNNNSEGDNFSLSNINLTIEDGEFISLLGPSGCGKTTLLRIIAGLTIPDKGKILEEGVDLAEVPVEKRNYAIVAQQPLLFPNMTLIENVCFGLKMKGVPKTQRIANRYGDD